MAHCPACLSTDVLTVAVADSHAYGGARKFVAYCRECGRCDHHGQTRYKGCEHCGRVATHRSAWAHADHLPRPRAMDDDEFAVRASLFFLWMNRPASEFVSRLHEFADWFAERDMPEEAACRAAWELYGGDRRTKDPRAWYQWAVPLAKGWTALIGQDTEFAEIVTNPKAKGLIGTRHNGAWFLAWPPGFVRFTGPLYFDHTRCRVTVSRNRSLGSGTRPVEKRNPAGYATLFHTPADRAEKILDRSAKKTPSLFDDSEPEVPA